MRKQRGKKRHSRNLQPAEPYEYHPAFRAGGFQLNIDNEHFYVYKKAEHITEAPEGIQVPCNITWVMHIPKNRPGRTMIQAVWMLPGSRQRHEERYFVHAGTVAESDVKEFVRGLRMKLFQSMLPP